MLQENLLSYGYDIVYSNSRSVDGSHKFWILQRKQKKSRTEQDNTKNKIQCLEKSTFFSSTHSPRWIIGFFQKFDRAS